MRAARGPETASGQRRPLSLPQQTVFRPQARLGFVLGAHYQLISIIGSGAYGVIYCALDLRTGRKVAVKALPKRCQEVPEWLGRKVRHRPSESASAVPLHHARPPSHLDAARPARPADAHPSHTYNTSVSSSSSMSSIASVASAAPSTAPTSVATSAAGSATAGLAPSALPIDRTAPTAPFDPAGHRLLPVTPLSLEAVTLCYLSQSAARSPLDLLYKEVVMHALVQSHPNIIPIYELLDSPDCLYLVMEYCPRSDLFHSITELNTFVGRFDQVREVFLQLVDAVLYCHSKGVYHCDIKPENILVADDGAVKLADFGLATMAVMSSDFGCGSSFYMAPERLLENNMTPQGARPQYNSAACDVWALGIILLNLTCGRNPWRKASLPDDRSFRSFLEDPKFLETIMAVSPELNHLMRRVLCLNPSQRISLANLRAEFVQVSRLSAQDMSGPRWVLNYAQRQEPYRAVAVRTPSPQVLPQTVDRQVAAAAQPTTPSKQLMPPFEAASASPASPKSPLPAGRFANSTPKRRFQHNVSASPLFMSPVNSPGAHAPPAATPFVLSPSRSKRLHSSLDETVAPSDGLLSPPPPAKLHFTPRRKPAPLTFVNATPQEPVAEDYHAITTDYSVYLEGDDIDLARKRAKQGRVAS